jgi:dTDP-4-amino-4,6-dideoxygalactose transaminase
MIDRNTVEFWGYNSRLDTVQAVVARHVLANIPSITKRRRENAAFLNERLQGLEQRRETMSGYLELPFDRKFSEQNYYLYSMHAKRRDELLAFLVANGVDAKVHYPRPLHLQPAAKALGYKEGDFPTAEWCAKTTISLPVHEFVTQEQLEHMAGLVRKFYDDKGA